MILLFLNSIEFWPRYGQNLDISIKAQMLNTIKLNLSHFDIHPFLIQGWIRRKQSDLLQTQCNSLRQLELPWSRTCIFEESAHLYRRGGGCRLCRCTAATITYRIDKTSRGVSLYRSGHPVGSLPIQQK